MIISLGLMATMSGGTLWIFFLRFSHFSGIASTCTIVNGYFYLIPKNEISNMVMLCIIFLEIGKI